MLPPELPSASSPVDGPKPSNFEDLTIFLAVTSYTLVTIGLLFPKNGLPASWAFWAIWLLGLGLVLWLVSRLLAKRRERRRYPLRGTPARYNAPFEPAVPPDDWDAIR